MSLKVYPGASNPSHQISLSDGRRRYGLRLEGGEGAVQEVPMTPSTIHISGGAGGKFGDWEPGLAQLEQRTWIGGRGSVDFSADKTRYFDAQMAFTMIDGKVFPAPQWKLWRGFKEAYEHLPGNVSWQALIEGTRFLSAGFTVGGSAFDVDTAYLWLRRVGSPGALTAALYTDDSGEPGTVLANSTASLTAAEIGDSISRWHGFDLSAAASLGAGTETHLVVYGAASDNRANHWEIGVDKQTLSGACYGSDGASWAAAEFRPYHRAVGAWTARRWYFFEFRGALYAVDRPADGAASTLLLNGARGKATAATSTTLSDSNQSWTADEWAGAWVRIISGTGAGQRREISGNTSTALTVGVWDITPSTDSLYVIYATDKWMDISPASGDQFDVPVTGKPLAAGMQAYFPRGAAQPILKMRWNHTGSPPAHEFDDDGTNCADLLYGFTDSTNQYQVWRAENDSVTVGRGSQGAWLAATSFGADIPVGDTSAEIVNLHDYNGGLYVYKGDGLYQIVSDKAQKEDTGLDFIRSENTGEAVCNRNFYNYFSWGGFALQQLQKNAAMVDMVSIGPDKGEGLPDERRGKISALGFHPAGLFAAVDAGEAGYSSVLVRTDPAGWHEVFRAPEVGWRIRDIYWQDCPGTFPRLWIDCGDEILYQKYPRNAFNPLKDAGMVYQHECTLTLADIDMGARQLPKFIKELNIISENLTTGIEVHAAYQLDDEIGGGQWIEAGTGVYVSPADCVPVLEGDVRKVRIRLRLLTDRADTPPVLLATVLEGYARTPLKYQWTMRVRAGGGEEHDPDEVLDWLKGAAERAQKVYMRSIWAQLDKKYVIVEPPSVLREYTEGGSWGGVFVLTLREA